MAGRVGTERNQRQVIRFDVLTDDVLLDIFDFYLLSYDDTEVETWQTLVHVCRQWRALVFQSPRRLNLRLYCTPKTRTRETLDVWPPLPLIVEADKMGSQSGTHNVIAALEHSDRVSKLDLTFSGPEVEVMQVPFPELTDLRLSSYDETLAIPDLFLGGSAPSLRRFALDGILFPGLPNLLLSTTHLVELGLTGNPCSWYTSPEAIVVLLSTLSHLKTLTLEPFPSSLPDGETRRLHLHKLSILPALETFKFYGGIEDFEDLVTLIDTPQLYSLEIISPYECDFDIQRLAHFISRTPKLNEHDEAHVELNCWHTHILFGTRISISCYDPDWQLSFVSQIGSFSITSAVKDLYIELKVQVLQDEPPEDDAIESTLWLQLLAPFMAVKNLYLHKEFATGIAAALKELVGGRITEVLPSLENIFVEEHESSRQAFEEYWAPFVVARQLSGHPVAIFGWDNDKKIESM